MVFGSSSPAFGSSSSPVPNFGTCSSPAFGTCSSSAFGSSSSSVPNFRTCSSPAFGTCSSSAFGSSSSPAFGTCSLPAFGTCSSSAFGSSSSPAFGTCSLPAFGTCSSSAFGSSSSPAFGTCSSPAFGSSSSPAFGTSSSPAFGSSPFASSNGVADIKQKMSKATAESPSLEQTSNGVIPKPAVEEAKPEVPSLEQNKAMGKSESLVEGLQPKATETNGEFEPCETMDGVPHIPRSGSLKGVETKEAKNGSASLPTESTGKSDKFTYTRILRGITHNPHFTPLQSYSKRSREKLIVGWDELFVETIDHIQSLTTKTFSTNVHELWKTIAELENLGYNVSRLKKRLDELTDVMKKRDSSEIDVSDLRAKADDYRKEKKRIEEDIADLQAQADKAQVMVDELVDQADKMESNLPTVDALFENMAKNPL